MATTKPKEIDPKANANNDEAPPKKSKLMLFIIIGLVILLIGGGAAYYFLVLQNKPTNPAEPKAVKYDAPVYNVLEPFTLNLSGGGQYLQIALTLQMKDSKAADRLKAYMPSIRSRVLLLLSSKTAEEVTTDEGKQLLKLNIKETIERPFVEGMAPFEITEVLITAFVVQ